MNGLLASRGSNHRLFAVRVLGNLMVIGFFQLSAPLLWLLMSSLLRAVATVCIAAFRRID